MKDGQQEVTNTMIANDRVSLFLACIANDSYITLKREIQQYLSHNVNSVWRALGSIFTLKFVSSMESKEILNFLMWDEKTNNWIKMYVKLRYILNKYLTHTHTLPGS